MTTQRDPDTILRAYLAVGMDVLSDRVIDSVLDEVHRTRRRTLVRPSRARISPRSTFGIAAVVALAVVAGSFVLWQGGRPAVVAPGPTASPVAVPSSAPAASAPASPTAVRPGTWIGVERMSTPRFRHSAVRLVDGRVLVVGGYPGYGPDGFDPQTTSVEIYDPEHGTWSSTGSTLLPPGGFPATLLSDGRVLVGDSSSGAELYDPNSGTWSATGPMVFGGSVATLLRDGTVLVTGNAGSELFDPDERTWTATASKFGQRHSHVALQLPDGRVLVAGGHAPGDSATATAELYDPETGSWTPTASMHVPRESIEASLQPDGKVLVIGGSYGGASVSAELYDPATGTWAPTGDRSIEGVDMNPSMNLMADRGWLLRHLAIGTMLERHVGGTGTLLLDGSVLVAGGGCTETDDECVATGFSEVYVPGGQSLPSSLATPGPTPIPTPRPSPTPVPTPFPPGSGPVPQGGRSWDIPVTNSGADPATLFVAEEDETGMTILVGSATPNILPPGTTMTVTFHVPSGPGRWSIFVNPAPRTGALLGPLDLPRATSIDIGSDGQGSWTGQ